VGEIQAILAKSLPQMIPSTLIARISIKSLRKMPSSRWPNSKHHILENSSKSEFQAFVKPRTDFCPFDFTQGRLPSSIIFAPATNKKRKNLT
jgi:hypothetical protein